ncbi:MAG: hypothetical protein FJW36_17680 [Acidobacteria bacterium]|nr:hypothetical protein [Acidobacteriota bacterium]
MLTRILLILLSFGAFLLAQSLDPSTLDGKVLLGYQGWFRCPAGGPMGTNWSHWANGTPTPASLVIDMYPDMREFEQGETCGVPGMTVGANPAQFFSSGNSKTVDRHFRWMQQYGLDGVLVQRFITDIPGNRSRGDVVLKNVIAAARRYGRVFALEYDISGANPATLLTTMQEDWKYLVETLELTAQPGYLRHNGKPVLGVWGIGLNSTRHPPSDPDAAIRLIQWFREEARVTYIGGTPGYWRTLSNDAATDPRWATVYQTMDGIQPWSVGRYNSMSAIDRWRTERLDPDLAATAQRQQIYMPVVFPGFSWHNLNRTAMQNQIPRNKGEFLWRQAHNAKAAGAKMLKIAMFDEVNESTAMFKLASKRTDAPDQGYWLTLDADGFTLPSDWYLRLAGEITRLFHDRAPLTAKLPEDPGPPYAGASRLAALNGASFQPGTAAMGSIVTLSGERLRTEPDALNTGLTVIDSSGLGRTPMVLYAASGQVNIVVPEGIASGPATLVAERDDGSLAYGRLQVQTVAPGIFTAAPGGSGPPAAIVRVEQPDGTISNAAVAACDAEGGCRPAPIDLGPSGSVAVLELYGTGVRGRSSLEGVTCTIGGENASVMLAGPSKHNPGLDHVHVMLPRSLAGRGLVTIRLVVDGVQANETQVAFR